MSLSWKIVPYFLLRFAVRPYEYTLSLAEGERKKTAEDHNVKSH